MPVDFLILILAKTAGIVFVLLCPPASPLPSTFCGDFYTHDNEELFGDDVFVWAFVVGSLMGGSLQIVRGLYLGYLSDPLDKIITFVLQLVKQLIRERLYLLGLGCVG